MWSLYLNGVVYMHIHTYTSPNIDVCVKRNIKFMVNTLLQWSLLQTITYTRRRIHTNAYMFIVTDTYTESYLTTLSKVPFKLWQVISDMA